MKQNAKKSLACLLAVLQLVLLLPMAVLPASAVDAAEPSDSAVPQLNDTIVGTTQFGTFHYTAMNDSEKLDGGDYVQPFVYTDDYFSAPSYSDALLEKIRTAAEDADWDKTFNWTELENPSLATASMDFTMACFGSNEEIGKNGTDEEYTLYSKNGEDFLRQCGFTEIAVNSIEDPASENKFNRFPTRDSIGIVMGAKDITVWNAETHSNEQYKLIAVAARGAGYGAEWASNLTLGTAGEHEGFRDAVNKAKVTFDQFVADQVQSGEKVKYWVCGYSRAGAVANMLAGDITDDLAKYHTTQKDVYGYTFECAAGADSAVDPDGTKYPNIHNIINKLDAIPRVSLAAFGNNRYGVDYLVPYYGNTADADENTAYYNGMYNILKTIELGYPNGSASDPTDPVMTDADPATYPVNNQITVHKFDIMGSDHTPEYTGKWNGETNFIGEQSGSRYYLWMDEFLDLFVDHFFGSRAWDYDFTQGKVVNVTDTATHREKYNTLQANQPETYQEAIRSLLGVALGVPGAKLTTMLDGLMDDITSDLIGAGSLYFSIHGLFGNGYDQRPDESHAETVSGHLEDMLGSVLLDRAPFNAHQSEMRTAFATLSPILSRLFLYDRKEYGSQFLGTMMYYMDPILVTHVPGVVSAWNKSLDENYIGNYRRLEAPLNATVTLYAFREGLDDALSFGSEGVQFAEAQNGALQTKDQRVYLETNESSQYLYYPASMDVRAEVQLPDGAEAQSVSLNVQEFVPGEHGTTLEASYSRDMTAGTDANGNYTKGNILPDSRTVLHTLAASEAPAAGCSETIASGDTMVMTIPTDGSCRSDVKGMNEIRNADIQWSDDARLSSSLFEAADGTYTLKTELFARADLEGTLRTVLSDKDFDLTAAMLDGEALADKEIRQDVSLRAGEQKIFTVTGLEPLRGGTLTAAVSAFGKQTVQAATVIGTETTAVDYAYGTTYSFTLPEDARPTVSGMDRFDAENGTITVTPPVLNGTEEADLSFPNVISVTAYSASEKLWKSYSMVPASSVYFDDDFRTVPFDSDEQPAPGDSAFSMTDADAAETLSYRFSGSRIDVYCTTAPASGSVTAMLCGEDGEVLSLNGEEQIVTASNRSEETRYNVPTISFDGLTPGTVYLLKLSGADYKLDGVRVYNPCEANTADFLNVRAMLLDPETEEGDGVLFGAIENGAVAPSAYDKAGVESEVSLAKGETIAFVVEGDCLVAVGMSAQENTSVLVNGSEQAISSVVDTYYAVTPKDGMVVITNDSDVPVEVTNIRLTPNGTVRVSSALRAYADELAAQIQPPEPTVDPSVLIRELISQFVARLFESVTKLFQ